MFVGIYKSVSREAGVERRAMERREKGERERREKRERGREEERRGRGGGGGVIGKITVNSQ
jgi:hypothetical protein